MKTAIAQHANPAPLPATKNRRSFTSGQIGLLLGSGNIGMKIIICRMMQRHFQILATLFLEPDPAPGSL
ncbi:hypothetical protein [Adonisia turfae]|nr:hypothetical protein [Adonisia turfae]